MDNEGERHAVAGYMPYLALLASLGLLTYVIPWSDVGNEARATARALQTLREHDISIYDDRTVRVFIEQGQAHEVDVEEWAERPLERRTHSNGTVEYYGTSGVAHMPACGTALGNVGIWVRHERNVLHYDTIPSDHELHVHVGGGTSKRKIVAKE